MQNVISKRGRCQFSLRWLFVAVLAGALGTAVWMNHQAVWAVVTCWAMSLILPAGTASGSVFFRGYVRAFFIGTTVTLFIYANATIYDTGPVLELLSSEAVSVEWLALSPSSMYITDTNEVIARRTVLVVGVSLLSGFLAMFICWLAQPTDATCQQDV